MQRCYALHNCTTSFILCIGFVHNLVLQCSVNQKDKKVLLWNALFMWQCGVDLRQIIHWQLTAGVPVSTAPPPQQCRTTECCSVLRAQSCNTLICASLDSEHCCSLSAVQCSEHNPQVVLSYNTLICASLDCCSVWPGVMLNIYNTFSNVSQFYNYTWLSCSF